MTEGLFYILTHKSFDEQPKGDGVEYNWETHKSKIFIVQTASINGLLL